MRYLVWVLAAATCGGGSAATPTAVTSTAKQHAPATTPAAPVAPNPAPAPAPATPAAAPATSLRWLAAASGPNPESSQVQIEQDITLAAEVFGPGGRVLFGAGRHAPTVQVLDATPSAEADPLLLALGDLFSPRGGRDAHYRAPTLVAHDAATADTVLQTLREAVSEPGEALLLYIAGHGDMAEDPRDNRIALWGQSEITVAGLGAVLDDARRPVRFVATTCFSGGFGELAFDQTDATRGAALTERCGLFAAPWDLEASGCDPNPDRAAQQGYGLHFLNALRGRDRDGNPVPLAALDLDDDGVVSLLEAHTRVRLFSEAADVPTTTSERWLRHAAPTTGPLHSVHLPEEDVVIATLMDRLHLTDDADAYAGLERLDGELQALQDAASRAAQDEDLAYRAAAASLLAQWPVLDDPWHPAFAATLHEHAAAITTHLDQSPAYADYLAARTRTDTAQQAMWAKHVESAPFERLVRALDNRALAGRLKAQGGAAWASYEALLACERATP